MSVLLRLALWQLKNALRDALTNPRKLIPLLLAAVVAVWFGYLVMHPPPGSVTPTVLLDILQAHRAEAHAVIFLLLSLFMAAMLDRGFAGGTLTVFCIRHRLSVPRPAFQPSRPRFQAAGCPRRAFCSPSFTICFGPRPG